MTQTIRLAGQDVTINVDAKVDSKSNQIIVEVMLAGLNSLASQCAYLAARVAELEAKAGLPYVRSKEPSPEVEARRAALEPEVERLWQLIMDDTKSAMKEAARRYDKPETPDER